MLAEVMKCKTLMEKHTVNIDFFTLQIFSKGVLSSPAVFICVSAHPC